MCEPKMDSPTQQPEEQSYCAAYNSSYRNDNDRPAEGVLQDCEMLRREKLIIHSADICFTHKKLAQDKIL
jgi:hypothetical protein